MDNSTSLTNRELDIIFGVLKPSIVKIALVVKNSNLNLDYVTLELNGHKYKVGVDQISNNCYEDPHFMISIPCEVKNE